MIIKANLDEYFPICIRENKNLIDIQLISLPNLKMNTTNIETLCLSNLNIQILVLQNINYIGIIPECISNWSLMVIQLQQLDNLYGTLPITIFSPKCDSLFYSFMNK